MLQKGTKAAKDRKPPKKFELSESTAGKFKEGWEAFGKFKWNEEMKEEEMSLSKK